MADNCDFSKIKLVCSDLDGTLICGRYNECLVAEPSVKVLRELEAEGIQIVLASGRPPRSMQPVFDLLKLDHPWLISVNGGLVLDNKQKAILKSFPIVDEHVYPAIKSIKDALGDDVCIGVESGMMFKCEEGYVAIRGTENMKHPYKCISQLEEFASEPVEKMVIIHKTWNAEQLYKYINTQVFTDPKWKDIINITFSNVHFIEISATNVSKGTTLKLLCDENQYTSDQVIAFGDMPNDVEMLRFAGIGVAMGNGHDDAKKAADFVTLSNLDGGVRVVLEKMLQQIRTIAN